MRGNARVTKRVTRFRRVAFLSQLKNAKCIKRGVRFPGALPRAKGNIWAYSPPQSFHQPLLVRPKEISITKNGVPARTLRFSDILQLRLS